MARKNKWKSQAEIQAELDAAEIETFPAAARLLDTPLGRALRKPGVTFRYWTSSSPHNAWVENKRGTYLFHSDENDFNCPVLAAFKTLSSFLDLVDSDMGVGGQAFVLSPEFITKVDQSKLDAKTAPPKKATRAGPRL